MKLHFKLLAALIVLALCSFYTPPAAFNKLLNHVGLTFKQPEGWIEVPVIENNKMHYDYAIKHPDKNIELRYTIMPMDEMLARYKETKQRTNSVVIHPNNYFKPVFITTLMNISMVARVPQTKTADSLAVKRDYNADRGMTAVTLTNPTFAQGYKNCMVIALQKDNVGYAYCFVLFNDQVDLNTLPPSFLYSLKFKP